ncbi:MAG: hypothetical protein IJ218_01515 [Alphaproteobacteria bacterium]|nr:hypothetical protein [Alphaproteobacteria bacterium]
MPTEKLLVKTKDNCVIVFDITFSNAAERARLVLECENLCKDVIYRNRRNNYTYSAEIDLDHKNTEFLNKEISGFHCRKDRAHFSNGMLADSPGDEPNTLYISHRMSDDDFPEMLKNIGYEIVPEDKSYDMHYDSSAGQFVTSPEYETRLAYVNSEGKKLSIIRNHFHFSARDFTRLQTLKAQFAAYRRTNRYITEQEFAQNNLTNQRDRALFFFYGQEVERNQHRDSLLAHELKHVKNSIFYGGISLKNDYKRLSAENYYRLAVEDERSAYLEQLVHDVNKYLQNGDMNDYSMFDEENDFFVNHLKSLRTDAEKLAYSTNWPRLVAEKINDFEIRHRSYYDNGQAGLAPRYDADGDNLNRQFLIETKYLINTAPLNAEIDADGSEFKKIRSLYYNYQIYNPQTRQMEQVNLSRYFTSKSEVSIPPDISREIIAPQEQRLQQRLRQFAADKSAGVIDVDLINQAKQMMRNNAVNHEFVTQIDNLQIATLFESPENASPVAPEQSPAPTPIVSDDHADWSDDLQHYWQRVDGYRELSKNNAEYKFKIKNTTVRYTGKKQVEVDSGAGYALYDKMLKEPSTRKAPVEFLDSLTEKQKLLLYVACVNNGRRMKGAVPKDLSAVEHLQEIPPAALNRFRHIQQGSSVYFSPSPSHNLLQSSTAAAQITTVRQRYAQER